MRFDNVAASFKSSANKLIESAKQVIVAKGGKVVASDVTESVRPDALGYTFSWSAADKEFNTTLAMAENAEGWRITLATTSEGKIIKESCLIGDHYWQAKDSKTAFDMSMEAVLASFTKNVAVPKLALCEEIAGKATPAAKNKYQMVPLGDDRVLMPVRDLHLHALVLGGQPALALGIDHHTLTILNDDAAPTLLIDHRIVRSRRMNVALITAHGPLAVLRQFLAAILDARVVAALLDLRPQLKVLHHSAARSGIRSSNALESSRCLSLILL